MQNPIGLYLAFRILAVVIAMFSRLFRRKRDLAVILSPSLEGSRGDEAMVDTAIAERRKDGDTPILLLSYKSIEQHTRLIQRHNVRVVSLQELLFKPWRLLLILARTISFRFIGADVVDGTYGARNSLLRIAVSEMFARSGAESAIVGFSFSATPHPECVAMMIGLPSNLTLVVRDPESLQRLETIMGRALVLSADLAFLLQPDATGIAPSELEWLEQKHSHEIIGFGTNALIYDPRNSAIVTSLCEFLHGILLEGRRLVLVSHDLRESVSDLELAERIFEGLPKIDQSKVLVLKQPYSPQQLKFLASRMDIIVSARMHFAIAGLSQGIPVFGLRYQGKFEGLYKHMGLQDLSTLQDAATLLTDPAAVVQKFETFIK